MPGPGRLIDDVGVLAPREHGVLDALQPLKMVAEPAYSVSNAPEADKVKISPFLLNKTASDLVFKVKSRNTFHCEEGDRQTRQCSPTDATFP